jgi:streptogramin lyase
MPASMRRAGIIAASLVLASLAGPASVGAAPQLAGQFNLTGAPGQIVRGSDGNMWTTLSGSGQNNDLARIRPSGNVKEYDVAELANPVGITNGPGGDLWLTQAAEVVRIPPGNVGNAQDFSIPAIVDARGIVKGPTGRLHTGSGEDLITFRASNPTNFDTDTINNMAARGITSAEGDLWIADFGGGRIVRTSPTGNVIRKYSVGGMPQEVTPAKDGIAFANPGANPQEVGLIGDTGGAKTTEVPPMSDPFGMDRAGDGKIWFAQFARDRLGILSQNGDVKRFDDLPNNSGPRYLVADGSTVWVSLEESEKVARIQGVN